MSNQRVATGVLTNSSPINYRKQKESRYPKEACCTVRHCDPAELEKELAAQFGDKLEPIREISATTKIPGAYGIADINVVKQAAAKAPKRERAKLLPKHIKPDRLVELSRQGKTVAEIAGLYSADVQTVQSKAAEWGIEGLLNG